MKGLDWIVVASDIAFDDDLEHVSDGAFRTYIELLGIAAFRLSDGRIAQRDAQKLCNTRYLARALAELSASGRVQFDGEELFLPKYAKWQKTREEVEESRAGNRRRADLFRSPDVKTAVRDRDGDYCRYCGRSVDWRDRRGGGGGTYDHVDPDGGNTVDNLVVCCRGCNAAKGHRTPEQAGWILGPSRLVTKSVLSDSSTRVEKSREEKKEAFARAREAKQPEDMNGAARWVAEWTLASEEAGIGTPGKADKDRFGAAVKRIADLDPAIMKDAIVRMVAESKGPHLADRIYGDCKRATEDEIFRSKTEVRRVR